MLFLRQNQLPGLWSVLAEGAPVNGGRGEHDWCEEDLVGAACGKCGTLPDGYKERVSMEGESLMLDGVHDGRRL